MGIKSKTKRLDVNYTPLQISGSIEVVGSVPDRSDIQQRCKRIYS